MIFSNKASEPLLFQTFGEYNPDYAAIQQLKMKVKDLEFEKNSGVITEKDWEREMRLLDNTIRKLEDKYYAKQ